ncbi:hypothetical protein HK101_011471 [Irineochytrium annulatum]|nr:hypothetical protein HK101_011471 [Irineochytrium annulatum]
MYTFDESLDLTSLLSAFSETPSPLRPFDAILHLTQGELSRFVDLYPYVLIPHATAASASPVNTIFFPSEIPLPPHLPPNRLFLGSSSAASAAAVTAMGITHVLNVTREVKIPEVEGLRSLRVAIDDSFKVDVVEAYLTLAREFLLEALTCPDGGNRVLVHCQYGRSRSVSMAVAALAELTPCSVVEALATVQCERPVSRPNLMFMMQLKMWDGEGKPAVRSANAIDKGDGGMETMTGR